jgi:hypothetical protein
MTWFDILVGALLSLLYLIALVAIWWPRRARIEENPLCPHGNGWDECPVCCH